MATTVHEPSQLDQLQPAHGGPDNGGSGNAPPDGMSRVAVEYSPPPSSTAIWVVLFAITMMFAAFTSALIVRKGSYADWRSFTLPPMLYLNTAVLICSSVTLEVARRRITAYMGSLKARTKNPARWLYVTLFFGALFVIGQYIAWRQLKAQGLYLATNPSSSFFYLLTFVHAVHVIGGLSGLGYVIYKVNHATLRRSTLVAAARYWHFMGGLWVYLLLLLWMKV
jgi:cytochrome c oxidase subunit III